MDPEQQVPAGQGTQEPQVPLGQQRQQGQMQGRPRGRVFLAGGRTKVQVLSLDFTQAVLHLSDSVFSNCEMGANVGPQFLDMLGAKYTLEVRVFQIFRK